jgi:hypothetical protein
MTKERDLAIAREAFRRGSLGIIDNANEDGESDLGTTLANVIAEVDAALPVEQRPGESTRRSLLGARDGETTDEALVRVLCERDEAQHGLAGVRLLCIGEEPPIEWTHDPRWTFVRTIRADRDAAITAQHAAEGKLAALVAVLGPLMEYLADPVRFAGPEAGERRRIAVRAALSDLDTTRRAHDERVAAEARAEERVKWARLEHERLRRTLTRDGALADAREEGRAAALEEAAKVCERLAQESESSGGFAIRFTAFLSAASEVRALITTKPTKAEAVLDEKVCERCGEVYRRKPGGYFGARCIMPESLAPYAKDCGGRLASKGDK